MNKKDRILGAALKLFTSQGIDATSTASIAEEAQVATGLLFHHFGNKETLIKHLYVTSVKRIGDQMAQSVPINARFSEKGFRAIWDGLVEAVQKEQETFIFLGHMGYSRYIGSKEKMVGFDILTSFEDFFRNGVKQGRLKPLPISVLLSQFFENTRFAALYIQEERCEKQEIEQLYRSVRDMVFKS